MSIDQQPKQLVRRAYNSVRLTRAVRMGLLCALFYLFYSLFRSTSTNDSVVENSLFIAVCAIWVGLSIQAKRKADLVATASQLIAAGQLSQAKEILSRVCRGLCIHSPVLLMACHNLAVILQKQRQYPAAWQLCELVRKWARKSSNRVRILSEVVRAECSLAMNNLDGAHESLEVLRGTSLNISERLGVLQTEITYSIRVGHNDTIMADLPNKVALAGLLPTEQAGLAHASMALAAHFAGQSARRNWLWRKACLYCPAEELLAGHPTFGPVAQAVNAGETQACNDVSLFIIVFL